MRRHGRIAVSNQPLAPKPKAAPSPPSGWIEDFQLPIMLGTQKKGAAKAAPDGRITILWTLRHPILAVKPQGRAKTAPSLIKAKGRLQDAETEVTITLKRPGRRFVPTPLRQGKGDYAGLAGVFFNER
jgi:hypothetical protein